MKIMMSLLAIPRKPKNGPVQKGTYCENGTHAIKIESTRRMLPLFKGSGRIVFEIEHDRGRKSCIESEGELVKRKNISNVSI